jgi:hypothetical protein
MDRYELSPDATSGDFIPIAVAVHAILGGLPVTMRSQNHSEFLIEDSTVKNRDYSGPILERVLAENAVIKTKPRGSVRKRAGDSGPPYKIAQVRQ